LLSPLQSSLLVLSDLEGIIQDGDGNAFLIAEYCTFDCRFVYFYFTENSFPLPSLQIAFFLLLGCTFSSNGTEGSH